MIYNVDCLQYLANCAPVRCMFADIPDNIGYDYVGFYDRKTEQEYRAWVRTLFWAACAKSEIFWLSYSQKHDLWVKAFLNDSVYGGFYHQIIWRYTFSQYNDKGLSIGYRPLIVTGKKDILNYDSIRTISERMRIGDSRAAGLRIPDDVWEYPRIVGNSKERRSWHPTQHPEALMHRVISLSCTQTVDGKTTPIGKIVDLCLGSGTTGIVATRMGVDWDGVEVSAFYCGKVLEILRQ